MYQLCESFCLDGRVRQRVIIGLGKLGELNIDQRFELFNRIEDMLRGVTPLTLEPADQKVENVALHFYEK